MLQIIVRCIWPIIQLGNLSFDCQVLCFRIQCLLHQLSVLLLIVVDQILIFVLHAVPLPDLNRLLFQLINSSLV